MSAVIESDAVAGQVDAAVIDDVVVLIIRG